MGPVDRIIETSAPASVVLVRSLLGPVFLSEGIQKFLYPDENGVGRFAKIGFPWPGITAAFVGVVEIVCGTLILIGLLTRLAALPLITSMIVAIVSTKIPILLGYGFWGFSLRNVPYYGLWGMAHDFCSSSVREVYRSIVICTRYGVTIYDFRLTI